ncbi:MAG: rod shape-determining protein MreD [Muribaculaceae bacterium]|nr:rod shape-determining protein MreD [Muribaculaceae bacterium]
MNKTATQMLGITLILLITQVIVLNHVCLFGVAVPFAFIYVLLRLPVTLHQNWALTIGFAMGLLIDIFSDTQGMNALSCTILTMLRKPVLRLYFPREDELSEAMPSISSLGFITYMKYALSMSLIYCTLIFIIEAFSLFNLVTLLLRIISSTILTTLLLIGIDSLTLRRREKRL